MKQQVLIAGITGMLGGKIAQAFLDRGEFGVRAIVRDAASKGAEVAAWHERGVSILEGDVMKPNTLDHALDGVSAVVSALNNQSELIVEGQTNLLRAAERQGVQRFMPSDFSVDYRALQLGDNHNLDMRKRFLPILEDSKVAHTLLLNGAFMDVLRAPFFPLLNMDQKQVFIWGDGSQAMDFSDTTDVAQFVAASLLDPRTSNQAVRVASDVKSSNELLALLPGFEAVSAGSVDSLKERIASRQKHATSPWEYLGDQYLWSMVSGVGKLKALDNAMYPEIQTTSIAKYLGLAESFFS